MNKSNDNFLIVQNSIDIEQNKAIEILHSEDDLIKPYALLNVDKFNSQQEADLFLFHLTNQANPIREACAIQLCEIGANEFLKTENNLKILSDGICDINPNIPRALICLISCDENFCSLMLPFLFDKIFQLLEDFRVYEVEFGAFCENKMKNRKNHAKNKKLFNLYWCLEALAEFLPKNFKNEDKILKIIEETINFLDYTIREKTAKILVKMENPPKELLHKLKNDENFYVKNLVYGKICDDSNIK